MASKRHNKRPPKFFMYIPKHVSDGFKIPDAFVEYLNGFLQKVVLRNAMGRLWHVEIGYSYTPNGVYLLNGWQKFLEDNVIEPGDFIVFSYDGDHSFDVKIFGESSCEKRETNGNAGIGVEVKRKEDDVIDIDDDESDDFIAEEEENIEEEEEEVHMNHRSKMNSKNKEGKSKKRTDVEAGSNEGFDTRFHFQTKNPHFKTKIRKCRRNQLLVPSYVIKDFGLKLAKNITFHDEQGRSWQGKLVKHSDGRTLINGWGVVCRWNNVDKDDLCICEFPGREGEQQDIIKVHINRGSGFGNQTTTKPLHTKA